jgi:hypothetical protein
VHAVNLPVVPQLDKSSHEGLCARDSPLLRRVSEQRNDTVLTHKTVQHRLVQPIDHIAIRLLKAATIQRVRYVVQKTLDKVRRREVRLNHAAVNQATASVLEHAHDGLELLTRQQDAGGPNGRNNFVGPFFAKMVARRIALGQSQDNAMQAVQALWQEWTLATLASLPTKGE